MPTKTKDYPLYTYDEPAVYNDFSGGINSDPSNEHLLDTELRDCVNMTYLSGALVKRQGGKKICDISCDDDLKNIQGIFLFTYRITYIIIAADGKLYKGVFNEDTEIKLTRLYIVRTKKTLDTLFDEEDAFAGLEEKQDYDIVINTNHDGYIQTYYRNQITNVSYIRNYRGKYSDIEAGSILVGDMFVEDNNHTYLCVKEFEKINYLPDEENSTKWQLLQYSGHTAGSIFIYNDGQNQINATDSDVEQQIAALPKSISLRMFDVNDNRMWREFDICYYKNKFYVCKADHRNMENALNNSEYIVDVTANDNYFVTETYMVFQNYRKVEAATLNNKLYIATGTRIIEVYLKENELTAHPVDPYLCNYTEIEKIGYNYMSPYPELAVASQLNTVTTSIKGIKIRKTIGGTYILTPVMNMQIGDSIYNYYYRWEKNIDGVWYVVVPFHIQKNIIIPGVDSDIPIEKKDYSYLQVDDADEYVYRCTFAKEFKIKTDISEIEEFDITSDYAKGKMVSVGAHVYKCIKSNNYEDTIYTDGIFDVYAYVKTESLDENNQPIYQKTLLWDEVFDVEYHPFLEKVIDENTGNISYRKTHVFDIEPEEVSGEYFGQAASVVFNNEMEINDKFLLIHSCTKVIADGNKLLFYGDKYNSGQWFKTIINNPGYITDRGGLSFKTSKNEAIVKVVPFQGNILVFANADNVGGSIHLVQGNGDDYDDQSGYYSPYQRRTINASITSSNADSIQICDNIIVFKYFNRIYYINASDLNNDTVKVTPCNDKLLSNNGEVKIPWDDDTCISEVTNNYYALIWKEKYTIDNDGDLVLDHPGIRVKMYYKMSVQNNDGLYSMPWLRDESFLFNSNFIIYVQGKPLYLYNNALVSFDRDFYSDIEREYDCKVHFKAVDLNYESFLKLIENCLVSFHRNQYNKIDLDVIIKNEGGHVLLDSRSKLYAANDLGSLFVGKKLNQNETNRVGTTVQDYKMFNTINMFPCLMVDTLVTAKTSGWFTLSGLTYEYTTIDAPDSNPSEIYNKIIRPKED